MEPVRSRRSAFLISGLVISVLAAVGGILVLGHRWSMNSTAVPRDSSVGQRHERDLIRIQDEACSGLENAPLSPIACYVEARKKTILDQMQARQLCFGSQSLEPVRCFLRARDEIAISIDDAIPLCRCATSTAPVDCVSSYLFNINNDFDRSEVYSLCSAIVTNHLWEDCIPRLY
jgi:hypothetical protein